MKVIKQSEIYIHIHEQKVYNDILSQQFSHSYKHKFPKHHIKLDFYKSNTILAFGSERFYIFLL